MEKQCKKSNKPQRWMLYLVSVSETKERRYIQEMLHRKAEAFYKTPEMVEEWEVSPLLWVCGTWGGGEAVNINRKQRRLGGFWRIDKEFGVWAVGLQLSTGHPGSAEEKGMEREIYESSAGDGNYNLHAMSRSVSKPLSCSISGNCSTLGIFYPIS